ncbi:uncharacterized protein V1510DRAFT_363690 [Dipodascopsis tothii]|uniref:uncharacterized protein n=1 Tax=Dipodascopsis tothii TaxID=44089 RepID=UPI0034CFF111
MRSIVWGASADERRTGGSGLDRAATVRLNGLLSHLAELFPETEVALLRDELAQTAADGADSVRLLEAAEALLDEPVLVASRRRVATGAVPAAERFRSREYVAGVRQIVGARYGDVLHASSIESVLTETNADLRQTLAVLDELVRTQAARRRLLAFLFRRRRTPAPLDVRAWIGVAGSAELDAELRALAAPAEAAQIAADRELARAANQAQYEELHETVECGCCFGDTAFDDLAVCADGHYFCRDCLTHALQEGVYGQGTLRGQPAVPCISAAAGDCAAAVPPAVLRARVPEELYKAYEDTLVEDFFSHNPDTVVRCMFCPYAETDELARPGVRVALTAGRVFWLVWSLGIFLPVVLAAVAYFAALRELVGAAQTAAAAAGGARAAALLADAGADMDAYVRALKRRVAVRRHGTVFVCRRPECGRQTCLVCHHEFRPFHKCFEKEEDMFRIVIERAMADAVKRTCPVCHVSFVKSSGCNKLVCPCGYTMCYVCRQDIRTEGYEHFCAHFREVPGSDCTECDRCDLYKVEDEEVAVERAAKAAEAEFYRTTGLGQLHEVRFTAGKASVDGFGRHNNPLLAVFESMLVTFGDLVLSE